MSDLTDIVDLVRSDDGARVGWITQESVIVDLTDALVPSPIQYDRSP